MATLRIVYLKEGEWLLRSEGEFPGNVEQIARSAPSYAIQYPHRFFLDGVLVHEQPAPAKRGKK